MKPTLTTSPMASARNYFFSIAVFLIFLLCQALPGEGYAQGNCLIVSDIHLNTDTSSGLTGLRNHDSNLGLVSNAITNMKIKSPHPAFIILAGDFVGHNIADSAKAEVMDKIASLFHKAFGDQVPVIPALGNNDSDRGNYIKQSPDFLERFAVTWRLADRGVDVASFKERGGYYAATIGNLKFIVLNSTLVSDSGQRYNKSKPEAFKKYSEGKTMLKWLADELQNTKSGQKVWLIYHIPPGKDAFGILSNALESKKYDADILLWDPVYSQSFVNLIAKDKLIKFHIASHVHRNEFKVFCNAAGKPVSYMRSVPSISPVYGNNPSFEVADFNNEYNVTRETNWVLDLDNTQKGWLNEYSFKFTLPPATPGSIFYSDNLFMYIWNLKTSLRFKLNEYIKFYNMGAPAGGGVSADLNTINYREYLNADVLRPDQ